MTMAFMVEDGVPSMRFETRDSASMLFRDVDIERADTSHLAFGGGAHFCLGASLARSAAQIAIPLLFKRFPSLRLYPQRAIEHKDVPVFNG
jgi:cytochrome P450